MVLTRCGKVHTQVTNQIVLLMMDTISSVPPPGQYYVEIILPPMGLVQARPNVGSDQNRDSDVTNANGLGTTSSFNVLSGDVKCDLGHGYYPMAQVGDRVWQDDNKNGIQDAGEPPVQGVVVKAYTAEGDMINSDITAADGRYNIDYLGKDEYYLKFDLPEGYGLTESNVGSDMSDSDVDGTNGPRTTMFYHLEPGDEVPHIDAGLVFGVVPLEWLSFTGEHKGSFNQLDWITANEVNVSHFDIERRFESEDDFVMIGKKSAVGNSSKEERYDYRDYDIAEAGVYYYRLNELDVDGRSEYSDVVSVIVSEEGEQGSLVKVYPNPTVDMVNVDVNLAQRSSVAITIWDAAGKLVMDNILNEELEAGFHNNRIDINNLVNGVYTVKVKIGRNTVNKKLVVLRN